MGDCSSVLTLFLALSLVSCASDRPETLDRAGAIGPWGELLGDPLTAEDLDELGLVSSSWFGYGLGASPGEWYDLGPAEWEDPANFWDNQQQLPEVAAPDGTEDAELAQQFAGAFVYVDYFAKRHYLVLASAEEIALVAASNDEPPAGPQESAADGVGGLSTTAVGEAAPAPYDSLTARLDPKHGWSGGSDQRVQQTPTNSYPFTTVGFQDPEAYCSGVLVGQKWVLTAAHCIIGTYGQGNYQRYYWSPDWDWHSARDGGTYHYFAEPIQGGFVPIQYTQAGGSLYYYRAYDYGLLALENAPDPISMSQPAAGWMAKTAPTDVQLFSWHLRNVGYPRCGVTGSPAGCVPLTQWRDPNQCVVDSFDQNVVDELVGARWWIHSFASVAT